MRLVAFAKGLSMQASSASLLLLCRNCGPALVATVMLIYSNSLYASSIGVSPIRVVLSAERHVGSITITNSSSQPKTVQLRLYDWQHHGNETELTDTKDLLAAPPIAVIPPQQSQIIRVGMRIQPDEITEKSYRLMIEELPSHQNAGVAIAVKISLPVFVKPISLAQAELSWFIETHETEKYLRVDNSGAAHAKIEHLSIFPALLRPGNATSNIYVLPGAFYRWKLQPELEHHPTLRLEATIHGKAVVYTVPLH